MGNPALTFRQELEGIATSADLWGVTIHFNMDDGPTVILLRGPGDEVDDPGVYRQIFSLLRSHVAESES